LENEIAPALRSGFIVLTDRHVYSLMARAFVRGMDSKWIRSIYSLALKPDATFYLRLSIDQLVPRVVFSRGFDYWESGLDLISGTRHVRQLLQLSDGTACRVRPVERRI
jgi:dTMP kinase